MSKLFGVDKPVSRPFYGVTGFNDANAWIDGNGSMTLGNAGFDDKAGDTTHKYAKGDVFVNVPLNWLLTLPNALTITRTSAGLYVAALTTNTTQVVIVPLTGMLRKFTNIAGGGQNPKGFKITDLVFNYIVATLAVTSVAVTFVTNLDVNAVARAAVTAPFGAVTYENPIGTVVANPAVATQATPYVTRAVPAAPVFVTTDNTDVFAEITFVIPNTSVPSLTHVGFHCSVALY